MDPSVSRVAILFNPKNRANRPMLKDTLGAAPALGVTILPLAVKNADDIDRAFATIRKERAGGLLQFVGLGGLRRQIVDLAAKNRLPALYTRGQWVAAGGLMSYGSSWPDLHRRAAIYIDKILRGANPADLPVEQRRRTRYLGSAVNSVSSR
jgi:putative tryptophan/tyrosine transport system substrate-binding protein